MTLTGTEDEASSSRQYKTRSNPLPHIHLDSRMNSGRVVKSSFYTRPSSSRSAFYTLVRPASSSSSWISSSMNECAQFRWIHSIGAQDILLLLLRLFRQRKRRIQLKYTYLFTYLQNTLDSGDFNASHTICLTVAKFCTKHKLRIYFISFLFHNRIKIP